MGILSALFGSKDTRELNKLKKTADKVMALEPEFQAMTDEELAACTQQYKDRYAAGEKLDDLLPEAFATVREASWRVLGMKHFYVQVIGGIVLHQGRIAEMKTGEGKTLVATLPAYLNALTGEGMHIVTVNEYLAKYHCDWMGKVFRFLGLTVSCNLRSMKKPEKRAAYNCDIMYTTNSELGFDYLRDNMVIKAEDRVQRPLTFAIVDEVDSILIDEARTPLIISGRGQTSSEPYIKADKFVRTLEPGRYVCPECGEEQSEEWIEKCGKTVYCAKCGAVCEHTGDFEIGEKNKTVYLNENGSAKAEEFYGIEDLSDFVYGYVDLLCYGFRYIQTRLFCHGQCLFFGSIGFILLLSQYVSLGFEHARCCVVSFFCFIICCGSFQQVFLCNVFLFFKRGKHGFEVFVKIYVIDVLSTQGTDVCLLSNETFA